MGVKPAPKLTGLRIFLVYKVRIKHLVIGSLFYA
jgi:hypothetical protein